MIELTIVEDDTIPTGICFCNMETALEIISSLKLQELKFKSG